MTPVDQTRFGFDGANEAPGNCWAACVASILNVPMSSVPDEAEFWQPGMKPAESWIPYQTKAHRWLFEQGIVLVETKCQHVHYCGPADCWAAYCILSGPSPRNPEVNHAVVGRGNEIVHDPHPSRKGLTGEWQKWWYEFFVRSGN